MVTYTYITIAYADEHQYKVRHGYTVPNVTCSVINAGANWNAFAYINTGHNTYGKCSTANGYEYGHIHAYSNRDQHSYAHAHKHRNPSALRSIVRHYHRSHSAVGQL